MPNGVKFDPTRYASRKDNLDAARTAITRLDQIIAGIDAATTAQIKTGIKDMATYEKHLIRIVAGELA